MSTYSNNKTIEYYSGGAVNSLAGSGLTVPSGKYFQGQIVVRASASVTMSYYGSGTVDVTVTLAPGCYPVTIPGPGGVGGTSDVGVIGCFFQNTP